ncbi:hypothetical protein FYZ35_05735 [Mobiluncus mulieris]|uniref:hypothetical protein n=1 Tax=Mobiluncus mulieris TaxID=2052 RepID=UPI0014703A29|nr:hypothetical protein [Mobiluncus mulieris]MCU9975603.1 hypothetical protein [Mobiluncus mulieris]MCU9994931.1 hypothetical protein [Mobiluncus mulieris]NMX01020.1 hypothetical protein [Mobiluncus mulieris]
MTGVYRRFWDNAEAAIEYAERMEAELGEAKAVQVYLYRFESALVPGRHFETLDLQNRCGVFTGEIFRGLGFRVEYVWVGGE